MGHIGVIRSRLLLGRRWTVPTGDQRPYARSLVAFSRVRESNPPEGPLRWRGVYPPARRTRNTPGIWDSLLMTPVSSLWSWTYSSRLMMA